MSLSPQKKSLNVTAANIAMGSELLLKREGRYYCERKRGDNSPFLNAGGLASIRLTKQGVGEKCFSN